MWAGVSWSLRPLRQVNKGKTWKFGPKWTRGMTHSAPGSGAGKGGGAGGSIKESGGGLGRFGAAQEEGYFYQKTREQLEKLKKKLTADQKGKREETPPK